jgi:hypothetical protein
MVSGAFELPINLVRLGEIKRVPKWMRVTLLNLRVALALPFLPCEFITDYSPDISRQLIFLTSPEVC